MLGHFGYHGAPILSSCESSTPSKKTRMHSLTAYCQFYGCIKDLSSCKDYHKRHKVCEVHSKIVVVNGIEQRFCQQCNRTVLEYNYVFTDKPPQVSVICPEVFSNGFSTSIKTQHETGFRPLSSLSFRPLSSLSIINGHHQPRSSLYRTTENNLPSFMKMLPHQLQVAARSMKTIDIMHMSLATPH
ncbi:hypothetical protein KIW84_056976 [Lathyrus oleraceus]|uniref:SBP-type domain-containing protein n=1 Tax=Pisum sativum TaxID=3888 RepID=A0A9D4X4N4_PEA|nr:hypothetical protein KIW84_056976 [Pisum sativum]